MTFTSAEESGDEATSISFIISPDGGGVCNQGTPGLLGSCECDVWAQDCPRGERCSPWANDGGDVWNATRCEEIPPDPAQVGDACMVEDNVASGADNCAEGSMCFNADPETLQGTCTSHCGSSEAQPMCALDTVCVIANNGALPLCLTECDPLLQVCPEGFGCFGVGDPGQSAPTVCLRENIGVLLEGANARPAACPLGQTAVQPGLVASCEDDELCCTPWCSLSMPDCDVGLGCEPWAEDGAPKAGDLGVCLES